MMTLHEHHVRRGRPAPAPLSALTLGAWVALLALGSAHAGAALAQAADDLSEHATDLGPAPAADGQAAPAGASVLVVEAFATDVDPVVGRYLTEWLVTGSRAQGYRVLGPEPAREHMLQAHMTYPPSLLALGKLARAAGVSRAMLAALWPEGGQYLYRIQLVDEDGEVVREVRDRADAATLQGNVHGALAEVLTERLDGSESDSATLSPEAEAALGARYLKPLQDASPPAPRFRHWGIALRGQTAFGFVAGGFRNHGMGARLDYHADSELSLGAYLGYANLQGRIDRASSLLGSLQVEQRVLMNDAGSIFVPLRAGAGYLISNGLVVNLAGGLGARLGDHIDLVVELLAPTFWVTPGQLLFSLDLGVEVGVGF